MFFMYKLKFWDTRSPSPASVLEMPEQVYGLDVRGKLMVVITAGRKIIIFDVGGPQPREDTRKESPLRFQSRSVACFPDQTGFAVGGIEGRVGIQYLQQSRNKEQFAFRCHRHGSEAFAVNAFAFQNQYGTFATVGSDGVVNFWDKDSRHRLKSFQPIQRSIPCAAFNSQGNLFAYASSYDWSKGHQFHYPESPNEIFVHYTTDDEIRPKTKRR